MDDDDDNDDDNDEFDSEAACNRARVARNRLEKEEFLQVHNTTQSCNFLHICMIHYV